MIVNLVILKLVRTNKIIKFKRIKIVIKMMELKKVKNVFKNLLKMIFLKITIEKNKYLA